ncbi:MAG: DUF6514 family protein [Eubacteriales bacterium]
MVFQTKYVQTFVDQEGTAVLLIYTLLTEHRWDGAHYGVELAMQRRQQAEKVFRLDVSSNLPRVDGLLATLAQNLVTPTGLSDVLEEWL